MSFDFAMDIVYLLLHLVIIWKLDNTICFVETSYNTTMDILGSLVMNVRARSKATVDLVDALSVTNSKINNCAYVRDKGINNDDESQAAA